MTKVCYISDIHLEGGEFDADESIPSGADILILAGDIFSCHYLYANQEVVDAFFANVCARFEKVIMVMGNHEYYGSDINWPSGIHRYLRDVKVRHDNLFVLDKTAINHGNYLFIGVTLWPALSNKNNHKVIKGGISDFRYIFNNGNFLEIADVQDMHRKDVEFLEFVLHTNQVPIVITHFLPSPLSISPRYQGDALNDYFMTDMSYLMTESRFNRIPHWFHGHTHDPVEAVFGETQIHCNPRGYVGQSASAAYRVAKEIIL